MKDDIIVRLYDKNSDVLTPLECVLNSIQYAETKMMEPIKIFAYVDFYYMILKKLSPTCSDCGIIDYNNSKAMGGMLFGVPFRMLKETDEFNGNKPTYYVACISVQKDYAPKVTVKKLSKSNFEFFDASFVSTPSDKIAPVIGSLWAKDLHVSSAIDIKKKDNPDNPDNPDDSDDDKGEVLHVF